MINVKIINPLREGFNEHINPESRGRVEGGAEGDQAQGRGRVVRRRGRLRCRALGQRG